MVEYNPTKWFFKRQDSGGIAVSAAFGLKKNTKWVPAYQMSTATDSGCGDANADKLFAMIDGMVAEQERALELVKSWLDRIPTEQRQEVACNLWRAEANYFSKRQLYEEAKVALLLIGDAYACCSARAVADSYRQFLALLIEDLVNSGTVEEKVEALQDIIEWVERVPIAYRLRLKNFGVPWDLPDPGYQVRVWSDGIDVRSSTSATALFVVKGRRTGCGR